MKKKGSTQAIIESVTRDRIGFVNASVKQLFSYDEVSSGVPAPPMSTVYGAVHTRTTIESEGGISTVRWIYEGIGDGVNQAIYLYEFQGSLESVPIQAHPGYSSWLNVYGYEDANGSWRPFRKLSSSTDSGGLSAGSSSGKKNPLLGAEQWLSIGGIWSRRYGQRDIPRDALNGVGIITSTVPGTPPAIPPGRNWLKGAPVVTWRGNAWDVTEQYILSGIGGHNKLIYSPASAYL